MDLFQIILLYFQVLNNLDKEISSSEHFRFMWYPHTDSAVLCYNDRTDKVR